MLKLYLFFVYLFFVSVCMCVCIYVCVQKQKTGIMSSLLLHYPPPCSLTPSLSLIQKLTISLGCLTRELPELACLCPAWQALQACTTMCDIYMNAGDLNSGHSAFKTSMLIHQAISPAPSILYGSVENNYCFVYLRFKTCFDGI